MKKKRVLFIGVFIVIVALIYIASKDWKYGLTMRVSDISPSGLTLHIKREERSSPRDLYLKDGTKLEKWTISGWETVSENVMAVNSGRVPPGYNNVTSIEWLRDCVPNGLYRVTRTMEIRGDEQSEKTYHAPFILIERWVKILIISVVVLMIALFLLQHRYGILKRKSLCLGILIAGLLLAGGIWCVVSHFWDDIIAIKYHYEVAVEEVTTIGITGEFKYNGDGRENRRLFINLLEVYSLEEKTAKGWNEIAEMRKDDGWETWVIREETTNEFTFTWKEECGELPEGTYRIVQPFYLKEKDKDDMKKGNMYITFDIDK